MAQIISKSEYQGAVMKLCLDKRGILKSQHFSSHDRIELNFEMPLSEIVFDFYDKLKSISRGYASFDYHIIGNRPATLVRLDILLNGEMCDALSTLIHRDYAYDFGRNLENDLPNTGSAPTLATTAGYREFDRQIVSISAQYKF